MKIKLSLLLMVVLFLSSCEIPGAVISTPVLPSGTQAADTAGCISSDPSQDDIDRALGYTDQIFSAPEWTRSYTVETNRVYVTWSSTANAMAFVEALIFPCGYGRTDLDNFFNAENWKIVFANYESYKAVAECKLGDVLRLYQFTAVKEGFEYDIKYWALNDTATRVMGMMIVFPTDSKSLMDEYSSNLFPQITSCQQ
jgi:hypothetical protein